MKNSYKYIVSCFLLLALVSESIDAQTEISYAKEQLGNESYQLFTDRNIYSAGDNVQFSVLPEKAPGIDGEKMLSRVYYVDVLSSDGRTIASGKYLIDRFGTRNSIKLPKSLNSGSYLLRGYTKWMMNFSSAEYHYSPILVVNYENQVIDKVIDLEKNFLTKESQEILHVKTSQRAYNKRDTLELEFSLPVQYAPLVSAPFVLSVVKKGCSFMNDYEIISDRVNDEKNDFEYDLLPETRGVSLSGVSKNIEDSLFGSKTISLSILGNEGEFFSMTTGNDGRFYFQLPEGFGERQMYLAAKNPNLKLYIDSDYATADIPDLIFQDVKSLDSSTIELLDEFLVYGQLRDLFQNNEADRSELDSTIAKDKYIFYGEADYTFDLNEYIELNSMTEYFSEVLFGARISRTGGEQTLVITDKNGYILGNNPLILIDLIPTDLSNILALHPRVIERIELINQQYVRGDQVYNGILSFFSKKEDFGGIKFNPTGQFFNYDLLSRQIEDDHTSFNQMNELPDLRTTLYWNSNIRLNSNGTKKIRICLGDIPGEYQVIVKTLAENGSILKGVNEFIIK